MNLATRAIAVVLIIGSLTAPLPAKAQEGGKTYRIGFLSITADHPESFVQALRDLGWVEGKNVVIEWRDWGGNAERLPGLATELVRLRVDVIVAIAAAATRAAKEATTTIPIVSMGVQDPVALRFVQSLARPGGNVTGPTLTAGLELVGKQLALLKETVPHVVRVAVLWNPENPMHTSVLREVEAAAPQMEVEVRPVVLRSPEEIGRAFSTVMRVRAEGLLVLADPMFFARRRQLADLAEQYRLPAIYSFAAHAEAGGLMAYGVNPGELLRLTAGYVDKILKGANPAVLPMEQPTMFDFVINERAARSLGIVIPKSVQLRAKWVIE